MNPRRNDRSIPCILAALLAALAGAACGGDDGSGPSVGAPAALLAASGDGQSGTVGAQLANPLVVRVTDASDRPVPGVTVTWSATGGGSVAAAGGTDNDGQARATWTLGTSAGEQTASASVGGLTAVDFRASAAAGPAAAVAKHAGDEQTGPAAEPLPTSVSVKVTDAFGNAVAGAGVTWSVTGGGGSVNPSSSTSDAGGVAGTQWTLGSRKGVNTLSANRAGAGAGGVSFTATATPNGTISGSVTTTNDFRSPALGPLAGGRASAFRLRAGPPPASVPRPPALASSPAGSIPGRQVPGSLIVTYHAAALGAPPLGSQAHSAAATAAAVGDQVRARLAQHAAVVDFTIDGVSPAILAARIAVDPARADEVRARLLADPAVAAVEQEHWVAGGSLDAVELPAGAAAAMPAVPNDPVYPAQAWHYRMIDLPRVWSRTTGSTSVLIAVLDDGTRFDHQDLAPNLTDDGYDFVAQVGVDVCGVSRDNAGDGDGYDADPTTPVRYDCNAGGAVSTAGGHGVSVAATVGAAGNDAYGVAGVNWRVRIRPVRVHGISGSGREYDVAQGILYAVGLPADDGAGGQVQAATGARIVNMSVGSPFDTQVQRNAVAAAASAGALLIASAMNNAVSAPYYPAAYPEVMAVSSVGPERTLAFYSNFGSHIEIAAPGGDNQQGGVFAMVISTAWNFVSNAPVIVGVQGTSNAAPHVAGVAGLLLAAEPGLTGAQLRARLTDHAVDVGAAGRDALYGFGLLNARNSLARNGAPARARHARLYDADTGAPLATVAAPAGGAYSFGGLDDGRYYVFAGEDEDGDAVIGLPERRWGAFGPSTVFPAAITIDGAGVQTMNVVAGHPLISEPNDLPSQADRLVVGGYVNAALFDGSDVDVFEVDVPAGTYTFETSGWYAGCGFLGEVDTVLTLFRPDGSIVAQNDNMGTSPFQFCSRVTAPLPAGRYFLVVSGKGFPGLYRVEARAGG